MMKMTGQTGGPIGRC